MKTNHSIALVATAAGAALILIALSPARSQTGDQVTQQQLQVKQASAELSRIEAELEGAKDALSLAEQRYKAGAATAEEVTKDRTEVSRLEAELQRYTANYQRESIKLTRQERAAALFRPVNLQLRNATVDEAATALSKASGINIVVDKQVPADIRLTMEVRQVPLGSVIESVADQAKLMIAPDSAGIKLTVAPLLDVNGEHREYIGANAPWSEEWGPMGSLAPGGVGGSPKWMYIPGVVGQAANANIVPLAGGYRVPTTTDGAVSLSPATSYGQVNSNRGVNDFRPNAAPTGAANSPTRGQGYSGNSARPGTNQQRPPASAQRYGQTGNGFYAPSSGAANPFLGAGLGGFGGQFAGPAPGGITVAQIADRAIVVCEPGVNKDGSVGAWLTVYTWEGHKLVRGATTFHAASPTPAGGRSFGNPPDGFGGGSGGSGGGFGGSGTGASSSGGHGGK